MCCLWQKRKLHINTDFLVTGWVLIVIPHIYKDEKDCSDFDPSKQVNSVMKPLFHRLYEDKIAVTLDLF